MIAQTADYDATDLDGQDERKEERQQRAISAALEARGDLAWLLSGRRGRRRVRRLLRDAGFYVDRDVVRPVFDRHHGQMCFSEGLRAQGLQMLWPIMRLLASGELPFESFQKLMTENEE